MNKNLGFGAIIVAVILAIFAFTQQSQISNLEAEVESLKAEKTKLMAESEAARKAAEKAFPSA